MLKRLRAIVNSADAWLDRMLACEHSYYSIRTDYVRDKLKE